MDITTENISDKIRKWSKVKVVITPNIYVIGGKFGVTYISKDDYYDKYFCERSYGEVIEEVFEYHLTVEIEKKSCSYS